MAQYLLLGLRRKTATCRGRIRERVRKDTLDLDTTRWRQIDSIFERALERPRGEQLRFVLDACGDDRRLGEEVLRLLAIDDGADDFLRHPPGELVSELQASAWVG